MRYLSDHSVDVGRRIPGGEGERGGLVWRSNGDQICVGIFFFFFGLEIVNASYAKIHR